MSYSTCTKWVSLQVLAAYLISLLIEINGSFASEFDYFTSDINKTML